MKISNKVILVTGGGNGIGQQLVLNLLQRGATVAAVDISEDGLNQTLHLAGSRADRLSLHKTDISNRDAVKALADEVLNRHGHIDGIINNAGIIHRFMPVSELGFDVIDRIINVNLHGVFNITKTFLPHLKTRPEANITNISSMGGLFAFPNQTIYGASKAAVKLFSEGLFAELRNTNIQVTVIFPGAIKTNIAHNCDAHVASLERLDKLFSGVSPETAAVKIIQAIEKNRFRAHIGVDAKILGFLYIFSPKYTILLISKAMKLVMGS